MEAFAGAPIGAEVGDVDEAAVYILFGEDVDGVEVDEVRGGAVGGDSEDAEVGLADGWLGWFSRGAGEPVVEFRE